MGQAGVLKRNPETARGVERILGLPEMDNWTNVKVEFGTDEFAVAQVTFMVSPEQVAQLARLMATLGADGIVHPGGATRVYVGVCHDTTPHGEHFMFWKNEVQQWCEGVEAPVITTAFDGLPGSFPQHSSISPKTK